MKCFFKSLNIESPKLQRDFESNQMRVTKIKSPEKERTLIRHYDEFILYESVSTANNHNLLTCKRRQEQVIICPLVMFS